MIDEANASEAMPIAIARPRKARRANWASLPAAAGEETVHDLAEPSRELLDYVAALQAGEFAGDDAHPSPGPMVRAVADLAGRHPVLMSCTGLCLSWAGWGLNAS